MSRASWSLARRTWGRGRAAGLTSHDDPLPSPGRLSSVGVTGLPICEQISRVDVAIQQAPCNFNDYIIPRSPDEDASAPPAAPAPQHRLPEMRSWASRRQPDWADALEPYGDVEAVDAAQLPTNMRHAQTAGGGDAGLRALQRLNRSSDSELDLLEECTNSSDMSNGESPPAPGRRGTLWRLAYPCNCTASGPA
ncbi:uncharacterized protein LOC119092445 [Pollicipes pollicipes]|uniref:uncharacterized protein LOC119092445 n=1 Tax=Pollicipes pollicipes TaxID=41117 RepID=UPI001884C554|nr:uncharacterized protein LOC119092445 [Pollicipes pollicipes]